VKVFVRHRWDVSLREAREIQKMIGERAVATPGRDVDKVEIVGGCDVAYNYKNRALAAVVLMDINTMDVVGKFTEISSVKFPYIPGYLSFRECPPLINLLKGLEMKPDILLIDGQGIAHPLRAGLATHIGVIFDIPTVGCAKKALLGDYKEPGKGRGAFSSLLFKDKKVGAVVRTKHAVSPVFVSPGHRIDFETARRLILQLSGRYRIPEPLRLADILSRSAKSN
jgi:deoxyribonuclease V